MSKKTFVLDLGFSSGKFKLGGQKGRFRSVYRKTGRDDGIPFNGERYIIGEKALLETGSSYMRTVHELVEFYPLFTGFAAAKAGLENGDTVNNLVVGLPYDFWVTESAKARKGDKLNALDTLKKNLSVVAINGDSVSFENVFVYPQGLGCIKAALANNPGVMGNVLGIDIGFNTAIYTLYSIPESDILLGKTFYKKGVHDMAVNYIMPELQKYAPGKSFTPVEISHIIESKSLQQGLNVTDLSVLIENASRTYIKDLMNTIIGDIEAHAGTIGFKTVVLAGGGARLMNNKISSSSLRIITLEEPEFANAVGFHIKAEETAV